MTALGRGYNALIRHPWLMLIPLLRDVAVLGLNYAGAPAAPVQTEITLIGQPSTSQIRAFLPSALPSVSDLRVPLAPAYQTPLVLASTPGALVTLLLMPALDGLAIALFLGLLGDVLAGRPLSWRRALWHWPAFTALDLLGRLALVTLPTELLIIGGILAALLFPALPFAIGVLNLPLMEALGSAPFIFWSRFRRWFGYGLLTGLITALATGLWALLGAGSLAALLIYPPLATVLVGGAATIALQDEPVEETEEASRAPAWALPLVAVAAVGLAWLGSSCVTAWQGFHPNREAALARSPAPPFASMFGSQTLNIVKVVPAGDGELVLARINENGLSLSALKRSRFGWKQITSDFMPADRGTTAPAVTLVRENPLGKGWLIAGELFDQRVAFLEDEVQRYRVDADVPVFLVEAIQEPRGQIRALDAAGQPVPNREVKRP